MTEVSKKKVIKKRGSKGKITKIVHESTKEIRVEKVLIDNFIALQKVMVNLSSRFNNLSDQIGKLLEIFEISAKSLARKDLEPDRENRDARRVLEKLDNLSQQAGLIGKGLALIHEANTGRHGSQPAQPAEIKPGLSSINGPMILPKKSAPEMRGYKKSIAHQPSQSPQSANQQTQENQ